MSIFVMLPAMFAKILMSRNQRINGVSRGVLFWLIRQAWFYYTARIGFPSRSFDEFIKSIFSPARTRSRRFVRYSGRHRGPSAAWIGFLRMKRISNTTPIATTLKLRNLKGLITFCNFLNNCKFFLLFSSVYVEILCLKKLRFICGD